MHIYPQDALFASRTAAPTGGVPSLTPGEITQLYQWWLNRPPDSTEMASEQDNAMKYSAAGIERQIANRAGNVADSGVRGDENLPALTVPPPQHVGNVITMGPAAIVPNGGVLAPSGPTGLAPGYYGAPTAPGGVPFMPSYGPPLMAGAAGLSTTTLLILGVVAAAALYFLVVRKG